MSFLGAQNSIALGVQGLIHIDTGVVGSADYLLAKSLRFRSSASAYLNRTPATATNQKTWTWSGWVKRGTLGATQNLATVANTGSSLYFYLRFLSTDVLEVFTYNSAGSVFVWQLQTTQVFRDPSAWYHIVVATDTTQGTASDRVKIYVNGVQITSFAVASYPTLNYDTVYNYNGASYVTSYLGAANFYDGELAELNSVDGQALAPTAFGAFSTYNQWLPIRYAGTYGTNGFYLPFSGGTATSYAGSFNGSSQYLTVANTALLEPSAAQAWTLETWINPTTVAADGQIYQYSPLVISTGNDFGIYATIVGGILYAGFYNGTTQYHVLSSATVAINTWTHIAVVSTGSVLTLYVNGVSVSSVSASAAPNATSLFFAKIGYLHAPTPRYFPGQISNFRFVKGTAVYTANFIPPTAALTAVTNTSLLTLQSATVVDNSGNSLAITNNGTVVTSVQSPFLNPRVLVADSSGNGNNWTPNNISLTAGSTYDSLTDVPTLTSTTVANYAVLNPLDKDTARGTISDANLKFAATAFSTYNAEACRATMGVTTGKWYYEFRGVTQAGIGNSALANFTTSTQNLTAVSSFGGTLTNYIGANANIPSDALQFQSSGYSASLANSTLFASYASGDVVNIAVDFTAGKIWIGKNGTWYNSGDPGAGTNATSTFTAPAGYNLPEFEVATSSSSAHQSSLTVNFGQRPFAYTAPTGFLPLNTFNIAAGTVTTSGTFTGNLSTDGPMVYLNGTPTAMTINGNAVTFGTQADKLANGFKVRSSSASYNASGSNTYTASVVGAVFKYEDAQSNP